MSNPSASAVRWCDQNGRRLTVMSSVCVYEGNALLSPSRPQSAGLRFRRLCVFLPRRVLCTRPLNKLTKGVQVYHMFSVPCLEHILLLVIFQTACSLTTLNFCWGGGGGGVGEVGSGEGVYNESANLFVWSCLSLYQAAVNDAPSL